MRRSVIVLAAVLLAGVAGCSGQDPEPTETQSAGGEGNTSAAPSNSPAESPSPSPEPFDPKSVDLAAQQWQFSTVYDAPVEVQLTDGSAKGPFGHWKGRFELGEDEPLYVDMDDDGDQDVIASMSFSAKMGPETYQWVATTWFVWLNDGEKLTQLPYPLAGSGDCGTQVSAVKPADGGGVVVKEAQMAWQSSCASGPSIRLTRTVEVAIGQDDQPWLVQTDPFPSWGGACPMMVEPSDREGKVLTAPGLEPASPDRKPVIVKGAKSWLSKQADGWDFVTYLQEEDPNFVSYCGWTQ